MSQNNHEKFQFQMTEKYGKTETIDTPDIVSVKDLDDKEHYRVREAEIHQTCDKRIEEILVLHLMSSTSPAEYILPIRTTRVPSSGENYAVKPEKQSYSVQGPHEVPATQNFKKSSIERDDYLWHLFGMGPTESQNFFWGY